jgi:hypothetical protein
MPSVNQNPVTSGVNTFYTVYEHLLWNTITLNASPRLTQDFEENMYGHRSGLQTPASGGGSIVSGPGGTAGTQTAGQAYTPASWPAPNVTVALPRVQAGMGESYFEQIQCRYNPEAA